MDGYIKLAVRRLGDREDASELMRLPYDTCWSDLECMIKTAFNFGKVEIKYIDEDADMIIVSSPEELFEAFTMAKRNNDELELLINSNEVNGVEFVDSSSNPFAGKDSSTQTNQPAIVDMNCENNTVLTRDEETGAVIRSKAVPSLKNLSISRPVLHDYVAPECVETQPVTDTAEPKPNISSSQCDSESGEKAPTSLSSNSSQDSDTIPLNSLTQLLKQLKQELKSEIVQDVMTKTQDSVSSTTSTTQTLPADSPYQLYWHEGIICDYCQRTIVGVRFKCGNCPDYDLCEQCENLTSVHDSTHVFLKLRRPCQIDTELQPLLRSIIYKPEGHNYSAAINFCEPASGEYEIIPDDMRQHAKLSKCQVKMAKMLNKKKKEEKLMELQMKYDEKLKRAYRQSCPMKKERMELRNSLGAAFVCDVTIPDGTKVQPLARLYKTWRMKNTGKFAWTEKTVMRLKSGNICPLATEVTVPFLQPGEKGDVTVCLSAPEQPGKYLSYWKLCHSSVLFGPRVWCSIEVVPKPADKSALGNYTLLKEELGDYPGSEKSQSACVDGASVPAAEKQIEEESAPTSATMTKKGDNVEVLNSVVAGAMAKLTMESPSVNCHLGQDLLSFENLNMHSRSTPKASHTATPNNTPLDVSPPKSPTPDMDQLTVSNSSSSSSSVALLPDELDTDYNPFAKDWAQNFGSFYPKRDLEADVESLDTLSDDELSQSDSDFYIVPLPDCFDPMKPLQPRTSEGAGSSEPHLDTELGQVDNNHNTIVSNNNTEHSPASAASVDELMTCADVNFPPPLLHPTLANTDCNKEVEAAAGGKAAASSPSGDNVMQPLLAHSGISAAGAAAAGDCVETTSNRRAHHHYHHQQQHHQHLHQQQQREHHQQQQQQQRDQQQQQMREHQQQQQQQPQQQPAAQQQQQQPQQQSAGAPAELGHCAMPPEQPTTGPCDINAAIAADREDPLHRDTLASSPIFLPNPLTTMAVHVASKVVHAYSTAKDAFYSLQAKPVDGVIQQGHSNMATNSAWSPSIGCEKHATNVNSNRNGTGVDETDCVTCLIGNCSKHSDQTDSSKSREATEYNGQKQWPKPHFQREPQSPMTKLIEMGFANRELNQTLLDKHNNDVQKVVQEILSTEDLNNWSTKRH
ncbi:next to BRCA1 gene 1 protein isoform X2 [Octopus sinensis]|uniref:Next to BRCA1 gene 1 protein isoform X2 n=1 Tax=Octopus sinensis TaxID=2607531 RepID=A0A7E6EQ62_9MOLL|nr:next to BRCA1 gene 1 protein isoform X2 [Octopus sinensis]